MKKLTPLALILTLAAFTHLLADDTVICVTKAGDTTAKVGKMDGKETTMVPIAFDSGADWTCVKDSYTVAPETASALMAKKDTISIGSDGTATFHSKKMKK